MNVEDFIFLASEYEGGRVFSPLAGQHLELASDLSTVYSLLTRGADGAEPSREISTPRFEPPTIG